ncbi:MAG: MFS transporter [Clostridiales bacterium]|nr:MFS transporter [Clostridiales bacterium]
MRNIIFLGMVSFFADISSEMAYPIIPLYLVSAFGATPFLVGVIEGIAESIASLLRVFSGYISDKYNRKKPLAFFGYFTGLLYKLMLIFAGSWSGVLGARIIDRFGKGIRTAPRDVMVSDNAEASQMGRAFGIHKALDMTGSAIGILLAFLLVRGVGAGSYKVVFAWSMIPVALSLAMFAFIRDRGRKRPVMKREHFWKNIKQLDGSLKLYLAIAFTFTLGNSSNAFLLLRANAVGFLNTEVILLYFIYNLVSAALAIPFGKRSDAVGRKRLLVAGYTVFSLVYLGFAFASSKALIIVSFVLYGFYTSLIAGVERAFIAEITPPAVKGTMLGLHSTLVGVALLPASLLAGMLWNAIGAWAPFTFGALMSAAAAILLGVFFRNKPKTA